MKRGLQTVFFVLAGVVGIDSCTKPDFEGSKKILNVAVDEEVKGFDPAHTSDEYSHLAIVQVYQPLYQYRYLKRPYEVEPLLAESMPRISKDSLTYTIRLRSNVFFHDDPAFSGKPRPVKASDVVYTLKRISDPRVKSPNWWLLDGHVVGLNDFRTKLERAETPVNYDDFPVKGLRALDDRTVVVQLTRPYKQLLYALAMPSTSIVAREVVEKYGPEFLNHPIGTGPFKLKEWVRGQKIVYEKNPNYWDEKYPSVGVAEDRADGLLRASGQPLPFVDSLVVWIFVETQPRWLNFLKGNLDFTAIPKEAYEDVFDSKMNMKSDLAAKGIAVSRVPNEDIVYFLFNMDDLILGKNKFLRQAISAAINREEMIKLFHRGRGIPAHGPISPGLFGYNPKLKDPNGYELNRAKRLMGEARKEYHLQGGKGEIPALLYDGFNSTTDRQIAEFVMQNLAQIGLKVELRVGTWPQFQERLMKKQHQFTFQSWLADYPDPENFLQLLYSKNASPGPNASNFKNARYDALYEEMRNMPDTPKRAKIIRGMVKIIHEEVPWVFLDYRLKLTARHAWLKNYKHHAIHKGPFKYLDLDLEEKKATLPLLR